MSRGTRTITGARDHLVSRLANGRLLLILGCLALSVGVLAAPARGTWTVVDGLAQIGDLLRGRGWLGDVGTDVVGLRRLVDGRDPYPVLGPALKEIGIAWDVPHRSTHPPTAYLLSAPIAWLPLGRAGQVWCLIGLGLLLLTFRCYGIPWTAAAGLSMLAGVWRPISASFHNVTLIWLAGVAVAWRYRDGGGLGSGLGVGMASLTKLLPLGLDLYFARRRRWSALLATAVVWAVALGTVVALHPDAVARYLQETAGNTVAQTVARPDNASLWRQAHALGGACGLALLGLYLLALLFRNHRALIWPDRAPAYAFLLYSYLAVALLPIAWGYSAAPLLPVLGYFALRGRTAHVVVAGGAFLWLAMVPPFSPLPALGTLATSALFWLAPPPEAPAHSRAERPTPS